jgi:hypothetical protein
MKIIPILASLLLASSTHAQPMKNDTFTAQRVAQTATILLNDRVDKVFPLFGAFEERKWAEGWNPTLIYPQKEIIEEGTTFRTHGHGHGENESSGRCRNTIRRGS